MAAHTFSGPKLKIARGRLHITELERDILDYLAREPRVMLLQVNEQTGKHKLAIKWRELTPDGLSLVFGDAVHNFRTALDILANDLVALSGATPKKVYFPFGDSQEGLEEQMKLKMKGASPDIIEIIRTFRPYRGGNEALRALHDLDIGDKHIAVIQTTVNVATPAMPLVDVPTLKPGRRILEADFSALQTEAVDLRGLPEDTDANIVTLGKVKGSSVELSIVNDLPFGGKPVIATLNELGNVAERVIQTFETHCLGRQ